MSGGHLGSQVRAASQSTPRFLVLSMSPGWGNRETQATRAPRQGASPAFQVNRPLGYREAPARRGGSGAWSLPALALPTGKLTRKV